MIVALTILFIGLKLMGFIDWSWFWVLSPVIGATTFFSIVVMVAVLNEIRRG